MFATGLIMLCFKNTRRKGAYLTIASIVSITASFLALSGKLYNEIRLFDIFTNLVFFCIAIIMSTVGLILLCVKENRHKGTFLIIVSIFSTILAVLPKIFIFGFLDALLTIAAFLFFVFTANVIIMFAFGVKMVCSKSTRRKGSFLIIATIFISCIYIGLSLSAENGLSYLALMLLIDAVVYGMIMFVTGIIMLFIEDEKEQGWTLIITGMFLLLTSFVCIQYINSAILEEENNYVLDHIEEFDSPQNALNYSENPSSSNADKNTQEPVKQKSETDN